MPALNSPFFNINYGWNLGESGWNSGMDYNLKILSFLDKGSVNDIVSSLPTSPTRGYSVINTTDNLIYLYIESWEIVNPQSGMYLYVLSSGKTYQYISSTWQEAPNVQTLKTDVDTLKQFNTDLVNPFSGTSSIARSSQVVSNIAGLKTLLKTSVSKYATVLGYYALGDTGSSKIYYLDSADTTSTDNGGTVIVANDGGRWKISDTNGLTFKDFGCKVDGATDDTLTAQSAITQMVGKTLRVNQGTMIVSYLQGFSNTVLIGSNDQGCIIKRKNSETSINPLLYFTGNKRSFKLDNFTLDGNKANQTVASNNLIIVSGCFDFRISNLKSVNAKNGTGLVILDTGDQTNLTRSIIEKSSFSANDNGGISISRSFYFDLICNSTLANGLDGISITNLTNPPPTSPTEQFYKILGNTCSYNSGSGIGISGYIDSYTSGGLQVTGNNHPTTYGAIISNNTIQGNTKYGLAFQSKSTSITNNVISGNGDSTLNGGVLLGSSLTVFSNNIVDSNIFYGIDAGGATDTIISSNSITNNGLNNTSGCIGLNLGAGQNLLVNGNYFKWNGNATGGGTNINIRGFDGGTDPVFNTLSRRISIKNNYIYQLNNLTYGVASSDGLVHLLVKDNEVFQGDQLRAFSLRSQSGLRTGNVHWPYATGDYSVAAATSVVIPDAVERVTISGTGNVSNIYTDGTNYFLGRLNFVTVVTGGSYTPGTTVPLTFSGGGATTQATGYGIVNNSGAIAAVQVTGLGAGYTSAPTVTPATGTATFSATINLNNTENNEIVVFLSSTAVLVSGGNLVLSGGNFTGNGVKSISLYGRNGVWYEKCRS